MVHKTAIIEYVWSVGEKHAILFCMAGKRDCKLGGRGEVVADKGGIEVVRQSFSPITIQ